MSSGELKLIKNLKENGYEGHLDPGMFRLIPRHLVKWLSENINSSVLLTQDELNRLEEIEKDSLLISGSSEGESSGFSCLKRNSESSLSSSETDDSDILLNKSLCEDVYNDDSDDDDEIKALKNEIRNEDERNAMLRHLKDNLMKKLVEANEIARAQEQKKVLVEQELIASTDELCALYKDMGCAFQKLVQHAQQVSAVLGSGDCAEKKFLHQVIEETLQKNFKNFLINVEKFVEQQKQEVSVPISEGEKFLLDSAPAEVKMDSLEGLRVNVLTEELCNLVPRIADLHERQLAAECAAFALPAAEKLLTSIQTGKYNITLEQLKSKTEELRGDVAKLDVEVEELSQRASQAIQQKAWAQVLPVLLSSAKEIIKNFSIKQQEQEKFKACMESYLCTLILLRSIVSSQSDSICHLTSFVSETHQYVTSKHSQVLMRMDLMHKLQEEHREEQMQASFSNILLRTFQKLLLGDEEPSCSTVDSAFDLMAASLNQLKAQNTLAWEEHCSSLVDKNMAVVLENKKEVESLSEYVLPRESAADYRSVVCGLNDKFAVARSAIENFIKKKEVFKSSYDAKKDKINQNSQLRKELLEWVKFVTHEKHLQDESFLESTTCSVQSNLESSGK